MIKVLYFREFRKFGYKKWHCPIGRTFDGDKRIYETHRLFSTPCGSVRIDTAPKIA